MKTLTFIKYIVTLLGMCLLIASAYFYNSTSNFLKEAIKTEGTVVELDRTVSKDDVKDPNGLHASVSYKPVVDFVTGNGEKIRFFSIVGSNPPIYYKGQKVEVVYLTASPNNAKIFDFFSLWGVALILGSGGGVFFLVGSGMILVPRLKENRDQYLREQGVPIKTEFQRVVKDESLEVNGRNPYRILTQWQNPSTSEIHVFKSNNLWYDPTSHIKSRQITVFIERDNPKKYVVDLSFLPVMSD